MASIDEELQIVFILISIAGLISMTGYFNIKRLTIFGMSVPIIFLFSNYSIQKKPMFGTYILDFIFITK